MNDNLKVIKVAKNDERFEALIDLYKKNLLSNSFINNIEDGRIISSDCIFEKSSNDADTNKETLKMTNTGAQWFSNDDEELKDANSKWQRNMDQISEEFHKQYSFLECVVDDNLVQKNDALRLLNNVSLENYKEENLVLIDNSKFSEEVLGLTMRILITDGTGEGTPIIGKIFFKGKQGELKPINKIESKKIIESTTSALEKNKDEAVEDVVKDTTYVQKELKNLIENSEGFEDYLSLTEQDEKIIQQINERCAEDEVRIFATSVSILNITSIKWFPTVYAVYTKTINGEENNYTLIIGANNTISLLCNLCNNSNFIIEDNKFNMIENEDEVVYHLDEISNDQLISLKSYNTYPFNLHGKIKECKISKPNCDICRKMVCSHMIDTKLDVCINCEHIERVYEYEGSKYLTQNMSYCNDLNTIIPNELITTCRSCNQDYTSESLDFDKCETCAKLDTDLGEENLYNKLSKMLPLSTRLTNFSKEKKCLINKNFIIFKVGKEKYIFNKESIVLDGYVKNPIRIKEDM